jgi:putative transposase
MKKKNTDQLEADTFYHIYNRGINSTAIFLEDKNYHFFLSRYALHVDSVVDTYAYCLMKNHFHFLIKTKSVEELMKADKRLSDRYGGFSWSS